MVVLASLAWGYFNTQKALSPARLPAQSAQDTEKKRPIWRRINYKPVLLVLLILILFALPIFRDITQAVAGSSAIELERQDALDTASRLVDTSDRTLARAWVLAQVGAQWAWLRYGSR